MKLYRTKRPPDYNLGTVEAVTIQNVRYKVVRAVGGAMVLIAAPHGQKWPASLQVKQWGGRVKGIEDTVGLYLVPVTGLYIHRRPAHAHA